MDYLVLILILIIFWLGLLVWKLRNNKIDKKSKSAEKMAGYIEKQVKEKEEHKQKILDFIAAQQSWGKSGRVSNDEAEKLTGVSNATAERYLNELEKEGKIKQVGKTGRSVFYEQI